jgi:mannosyltransferase
MTGTMINHRICTTYTKIQNHPASPYLLLGAITLLAAVLRFYKLGEWSFWIDEIYTINRTQTHFSNILSVLQNLPARLWLPLSFVFTKFALNIFGVTEFSARLVSTLIGIITIPALFFYTRKYFGVGVALLLALLLAVAPWHLYWSQNARFYTSLLVFYTMAGLSFFYAIEFDHPWSFVLFYGFLYLAMSERLQAAFLLPVAFAYLGSLRIFRFERPPGLNKRNLLIFAIPFLLMLLFELVRYLLRGASTTTSFIQDFSGLQVSDPIRLLFSIIFNISFPVLAFALVSSIYLIHKKDRAGLYLLISALLPIILLVLLNPFVFTKDRYVFMTLPFWLLLAAIGTKVLYTHVRGNGKLLAAGVLVIFLAQAFSSYLLYYQVNHGNRLDWRTAFEIVKEQSQPEDIVVAFWPEFAPFYLDREIQPYEDTRSESIMQSDQRHWIVIDSETIYANVPLMNWVEQETRLIRVLYLRQPEGNFFLRIYLYDPLDNSSLDQNE